MNERRRLALILMTGLIVRLGWGLSRPADDAAIDLLPDQRGYLEIARNLVSGAGLHYVDERFGQTVYAARTPGYPAFLALCGGSIRAARVAQAIIDTSTAFAVYLLARRLTTSGRAAVLAAMFVAFNPFLVYFSALLLTETLYTSMLAWGMLLLLGSGWRWIWGAALLALAIHVRPAGVGLPLLLGCAAFVPRAAGSFQRPGILARSVVAFVLTVLALAPWGFRNYRLFNHPLWSTTNDGITFYDGFHPGATGASDQSVVNAMPEVKGMGELERSDYFKTKAIEFIRHNPGRVASLTFVKIARTWSPVPLSDEFGRPLYRVIALLFAVPFDVLVIVGIVRGRLNRQAILFLLAPALYFTLIHAMSVGSLRYRVPAEPPLAVLAGLGAAGIISRSKNDARTAPS